MSVEDAKKIKNGIAIAVISGIILQVVAGVIITTKTSKAINIDLKYRVETLEEKSDNYANKNDVNTIYSVLTRSNEENRLKSIKLEEELLEQRKASELAYKQLDKSIDDNFKFIIQEMKNLN